MRRPASHCGATQNVHGHFLQRHPLGLDVGGPHRAELIHCPLEVGCSRGVKAALRAVIQK
jgi:hypothetical protein